MSPFLTIFTSSSQATIQNTTRRGLTWLTSWLSRVTRTCCLGSAKTKESSYSLKCAKRQTKRFSLVALACNSWCTFVRLASRQFTWSMEKRKEAYSKQSTNSRRQRYLKAWPPKVCFWTILRVTFTALTNTSTSGSLKEMSACTTAKLSKLERQQLQSESLSPRLKFIVLRRLLFKRNCSSKRPQMWKHTWKSTTRGITYSRTSTQNSSLMS